MKISLSWLCDYLKTEQTAEQLAETLLRSGLEVKSITTHGAAIPHVVTAQILESVQHPNADRLSVCKVDEGSGIPRQIVCGAKNYQVGDKILLALPGAVLPGGLKIKVGKLRGVESEGMMCSSKELGLGEGAEGLHILPPTTMIGTAVEKLFPVDAILELEVTPNRPDWLGYIGVAREAAAFEGGEFVAPSLSFPTMAEEVKMAAIVAQKECSFYSIRKIDQIRMQPSPSWLVQRLTAMDFRPINLVVDIANYVMLETAQPLHAFDAAQIQGALHVRFAHDGECLEALDGKTYQLRSSDLVIADDKGPQALAGIIGGKKSGVSEKTTSVLLESALFEEATIAATIRFHGIHTEAGYRFERGNRAGTLEASTRAVTLLCELTGGIASEELFVAGQLPAPLEIQLSGERVRQLLGITIDDAQIDTYLKKLGLIKNHNAWQIPSWRPDLRRAVDLVEEIARLYGIEAITSRCMAFAAPSSQEDKIYDQLMSFRHKLTAGGFFEARTGTLVAKDVADEKAIALRNPMGEQQAFLRTSLLPGLKKVLLHNLQQGASSIRMFEIGKVFQKSDQLEQEEQHSLALIVTGVVTPSSWRGEAQRFLDLYDIKGMLDFLVPEKINYQVAEEALPSDVSLGMHIIYQQKKIGYLGLLHPAIARKFMLTGQEQPIAVAELDISALCQIGGEDHWKRGGSLARFPSVTRDVAFIVDKSLSYALLEETLLSAKEVLLQEVAPFDIFVDPSGEKIAPDKKSIAISLKFQHDERTLTTQEVQEACDRLSVLLKNSFGAEVRS